jgi:lipid-A-disaccharide synthase-like uncharacterized protein
MIDLKLDFFASLGNRRAKRQLTHDADSLRARAADGTGCTMQANTVPAAAPSHAAEVTSDNLLTTIAVGVLAYASADVAHHALGHGGACLLLGGRLVSLSSIFVDCTVRGTAVDLAGPLANLVIGLVAIGVMHARTRPLAPAASLFVALVAGFNLLWFMMQMVFSVATATDDFAWAMHEYSVGVPVRIAAIAVGVVGYVLSIRWVARTLAAFAQPRARLARLMWTCWLSAGVVACVTALFDRDPVHAIVAHAAPQSLVLAVGLLAVPAVASRAPAAIAAPRIALSAPWLIAAAVTVLASVVFLGPGFSIPG